MPSYFSLSLWLWYNHCKSHHYQILMASSTKLYIRERNILSKQVNNFHLSSQEKKMRRRKILRKSSSLMSTKWKFLIFWKGLIQTSRMVWPANRQNLAMRSTALTSWLRLQPLRSGSSSVRICSPGSPVCSGSELSSASWPTVSRPRLMRSLQMTISTSELSSLLSSPSPASSPTTRNPSQPKSWSLSRISCPSTLWSDVMGRKSLFLLPRWEN